MPVPPPAGRARPAPRPALSPARRHAPAAALLLCALALVLAMANGLWTDSVDLAHHYALVARLSAQWTLPAGIDASLGEMNVYPRGAHWVAALAARLTGSPLLGLQLCALGAFVTVWLVLLCMLRQLPARAGALSAATLAVLLLANRHWLRLELYGGELQTNFFFSQLAGQAAALLAVLAALRLERAGLAPPWRYLLLLAALPVVCAIHLLPAAELLMLLGLACATDLLPGRRGGRGQILLSLLTPVAGALLLAAQPGFAVMREISANNGGMPTAHLGSMGAFGLYAGAVLALAAAQLRSWLAIGVPQRAALALGVKYLALWGMACALMCLLQLLLLAGGAGSPYAVKKYVFALHSAMLLQLCLLPAMLLAWHRNLGPRAQGRPGPLAPAPWEAYLLPLWPALLALATLGTLPAAPQAGATALAPLVALERQLGQLRDTLLPAMPGRATYVTQLPGLSPTLAYMFTIGTFGTARDDNAYDVLGGQGPRATRAVDAILTHPDAPYGRLTACRRAGGTAALAIVDGACVDALLHPSGAHLGLGAHDPAPPCTLAGLAAPAGGGRAVTAPLATVDCRRPLLNGQPARAVTVTLRLLPALRAGQPLQLSANGAAPVSASYDRYWPVRRLTLPLAAGAGPRLHLTLTLPAGPVPGAELSALDFD